MPHTIALYAYDTLWALMVLLTWASYSGMADLCGAHTRARYLVWGKTSQFYQAPSAMQQRRLHRRDTRNHVRMKPDQGLGDLREGKRRQSRRFSRSAPYPPSQIIKFLKEFDNPVPTMSA